MRTTDVTIQFNTGFMDGDKPIKLEGDEAKSNLEGLIQHMKDIMPDPDDLDAGDVEKISFGSLAIGKWKSPHDSEFWASSCAAEAESVSQEYTMQLTVSIRHENAVGDLVMQSIVDAIYENGANFPFTPDAEDALPATFFYPYHSIISDLDDGRCVGKAC